MKRITCIGLTLAILIALAFIFYPEKSAQAKQSIEAAGAVAVQKTIAALEKRVGQADVALEHYKTVLQAKRKSLVQLKTLKANCERQISECRATIASRKSQGADAAAKEAELRMLEQRMPSLAASAEKAEQGYKQFQLVFKQKKAELDVLKAKMQSLGAELTAVGGGDAGYALQKARELEDEVKSECNRLESELEVQAIDEENQ